MRVLIIDVETLGLDFALRCAAWEHEVRIFKDAKKPVRDGEGFKDIKIVEDYRDHMAWARDGLIICTGNCKFMRELDRYREHGFKIFAPTAKSSALEIDRKFGMEEFKRAGIDVPPYKEFASFEAAAAFARKSDQTWVFKPLGSEDDKSLTYVSSDPADLVGWLQWQIRRGKQLKGSCILQEKIDCECEIGINGWFGPDGFLPEKYQISFEHKPLMPGDIGPNTGEAVSVSKYVTNDKLVADFLTPMVGTLKASGHRGDFCIGAMIDKAGKSWPLEATARLGYPALFGQMASHKGDPAQWMRDLLDGKDTLKVSQDVCMSVVVGQPRYPYNASPPELVEGNPINGITDDNIDDLHFCAVMRAKGVVEKDGKITEAAAYQTTGEYVLVATSLGKTIKRAKDRVYSVIEQIRIPNMIYRNDGGDKVEKALPYLHKAGYALELEA